MSTNGELNRKLRMGMVGGGQGAFIGKVHSIAAVMDNRAALVAGALSSDPAKAKASAPDYDIAEDRAYGSFEEMFAAEKNLPEDRRIDFVSVCTPNHVHFPVAKAAIEAGLNVVCDKPMTFDLDQAEDLLTLVEGSDVVFALTHNYTGNPLVRQARSMILGGEFGEIQAIRSSYLQGWLRERIELEGQKQSSWRTDPSKSGAAGAFGDIATHAYNLGRYMTGLLPAEVSAMLMTMEKGRKLDDYGIATVKYQNGAVGQITASQITTGRENDLSIEIDGTRKSCVWRQENPNELVVRENGKPHRIYTRDPNAPYAAEAMSSCCRTPSGHPEGYLEAFANVYCAAYDAMVERAEGKSFEKKDTVYPNVHDGLDGMNFITQCVASSAAGGAWQDLSLISNRK